MMPCFGGGCFVWVCVCLGGCVCGVCVWRLPLVRLPVGALCRTRARARAHGYACKRAQRRPPRRRVAATETHLRTLDRDVQQRAHADQVDAQLRVLERHVAVQLLLVAAVWHFGAMCCKTLSRLNPRCCRLCAHETRRLAWRIARAPTRSHRGLGCRSPSARGVSTREKRLLGAGGCDASKTRQLSALVSENEGADNLNCL